MDGLKDKMHYLSERQSVIARNIANADTPDYKAQDLLPLSLPSSSKSMGVSVQRTSPLHFMGTSKPSRFRTIEQQSAYETAPNGNNVVLEEQMVKLSETDMQYQTTLNVMRKVKGMVQMSIGANR